MSDFYNEIIGLRHETLDLLDKIAYIKNRLASDGDPDRDNNGLWVLTHLQIAYNQIHNGVCHMYEAQDFALEYDNRELVPE